MNLIYSFIYSLIHSPIHQFNIIHSFIKWYRKFNSPTYYGHYWELGSTGLTSKKEVAKAIGKHFMIKSIFNVKEYPFHRFFILEKNTN